MAKELGSPWKHEGPEMGRSPGPEMRLRQTPSSGDFDTQYSRNLCD